MEERSVREFIDLKFGETSDSMFDFVVQLVEQRLGDVARDTMICLPRARLTFPQGIFLEQRTHSIISDSQVHFG